MKLRKTAGIIIAVVLIISLLAGCGSSAPDNFEKSSTGSAEAVSAAKSEAGSADDSKADKAESSAAAGAESSATQSAADPAEETETASEAESEEPDVEKTEVFNESDVVISIGSAEIKDGSVEFTMYVNNTANERRFLFGKQFMINGISIPSENREMEIHDADSSSTVSSLLTFLEIGKELRSAVTVRGDDIRSGDAVQVDYELEIEDDDDNVLATRFIEFGITADGEIVVGEELKALGLAPIRNIEAETFPETVVFDQNGVRITAEGFRFDEENRRVISLTIVNGLPSEIKVRGNNAIVDGYVIAISGGGDVEVPAGETVTAEFILNQNQMDLSGIVSIRELSMSWYIDGEGLDDSSYPTDMVSTETDSESVIQERDTGSFDQLHNADGIVISAEPQAHTDQFGDKQLYLLYENDTDDLLATDTIIELGAGGSRSGSFYLYPHSKHWNAIGVHEGDVYYVRIADADWHKLFETEKTAVVIP